MKLKYALIVLGGAFASLQAVGANQSPLYFEQYTYKESYDSAEDQISRCPTFFGLRRAAQHRLWQTFPPSAREKRFILTSERQERSPRTKMHDPTRYEVEVSAVVVGLEGDACVSRPLSHAEIKIFSIHKRELGSVVFWPEDLYLDCRPNKLARLALNKQGAKRFLSLLEMADHIGNPVHTQVTIWSKDERPTHLTIRGINRNLLIQNPADTCAQVLAGTSSGVDELLDIVQKD